MPFLDPGVFAMTHDLPLYKPRRRADCSSVARPCPHHDCRYHLGDSGRDSCALDVADRVGPYELSIKEIAELMSMSTESVTDALATALAKVDVAQREVAV